MRYHIHERNKQYQLLVFYARITYLARMKYVIFSSISSFIIINNIYGGIMGEEIDM